MSYVIQDEHGNNAQVATTSGWSEFCDWAKKLPAVNCLGIRHLCEQGWDRDLDVLASELDEALKNYAPTANVKSVGNGIKSFLNDSVEREIILVTNGIEE